MLFFLSYYGVFLVVGFIILIYQIYKIKKYTAVLSIVIDVIKEKDSEGDTFYRPIFKFHKPNGNEVIYKNKTGSNPCRYNAGDKVQLLFDENTHQVKGILHVINRFLLPFILINIGVTSLLFLIAIEHSDEIFMFIRSL